MKTKIISLFLAVLLVTSMAGSIVWAEEAAPAPDKLPDTIPDGIYMEDTGETPDDAEASVSVRQLPCYLMDPANLLEIPVYYINDVEDLAYIDLKDWCGIMAGCMFQISSPFHMSYLKNGSYYDTDKGVDPDCVIVNPENFYDREALTEYINHLF